jgi:hypothetical protein
MIREVKGYPLLLGVRGKPAADTEALADALAALSRFADARRNEFAEIDVNPFLVRAAGSGAAALDALIVSRGTR